MHRTVGFGQILLCFAHFGADCNLYLYFAGLTASAASRAVQTPEMQALMRQYVRTGNALNETEEAAEEYRIYWTVACDKYKKDAPSIDFGSP